MAPGRLNTSQLKPQRQAADSTNDIALPPKNKTKNSGWEAVMDEVDTIMHLSAAWT